MIHSIETQQHNVNFTMHMVVILHKSECVSDLVYWDGVIWYYNY